MKSKFFKHTHPDPNCVTGDEQVMATDDGVSYYTYLAFPLCEDGYRDGMQALLNERYGWETGVLGLVYKENMPHAKLLDCLAFTAGYKIVYAREVSDQFAEIKLTLGAFLDLVEFEAAWILDAFHKQYLNIETVRDINGLLTKKQFAFTVVYA